MKNKITPKIRKDFQLIASRLPEPKQELGTRIENGNAVIFNKPTVSHFRRISNAFKKEGAKGVEKYVRQVTEQ